jgi:hypothetical protein
VGADGAGVLAAMAGVEHDGGNAGVGARHRLARQIDSGDRDHGDLGARQIPAFDIGIIRLDRRQRPVRGRLIGAARERHRLGRGDLDRQDGRHHAVRLGVIGDHQRAARGRRRRRLRLRFFGHGRQDWIPVDGGRDLVGPAGLEINEDARRRRSLRQQCLRLRDSRGLREFEDHSPARAGSRLDANRLDQAMSFRRLAAVEVNSGVFQRNDDLARISLRLDAVLGGSAEIENDSRAVGMDAEPDIDHVGCGRCPPWEGERQPCGEKAGESQQLDRALLHYW